MELQKYFKTGKRLKVAMDYDIEGLEDYFDNNFAYLMFDCDYGSTPTNQEALNGDLFPVPYWCLEGTIEYSLTGNQDYDTEKCLAQYIPNMYCKYQYGDTEIIKGKQYKFITTISLPEEVEHQADDGTCCYEYRGFSHLIIWQEIY